MDEFIQKRPYTLDEYEQLSPGDIGYISPEAISIVVDHSTWAEPKQVKMSDFLFENHIESGTVNLTSVNVSESYDTNFALSKYFLIIMAYKDVEQKIGETTVTVRENVLFHSLNATTSGFSLVLDEYEGVTLKYFAYE